MNSQLTDLLTRFRQTLKGDLLLPDHPAYEEKRKAWNYAINQYPAAILVAADANDIVQGVRMAREAGLGVAVQATGHGISQSVSGHLLILTAALDEVTINPATRTARVGAGVVWKQVVEVGGAHGLAPLLGSAPDVGVVGYTLGGGIGWMARQYGLAVDSVMAIEVVTGDGVLRHASATEESELFWGLRGAGNALGIVTAIEFMLYPLTTIYGGTLTYPPELAAEALRFYREWVTTLPNEMTSAFTMFHYPAIAPAELRGTREVWIRAVFTGSADEGAAWMRPWLKWQTPTQNSFQTLPFTEIGAISNDPRDPSPGYSSNELFDQLSDGAIEVLSTYAAQDDSPIAMLELRHAGGAIARVAPDSNAIGFHDALFYLRVGGYAPTPDIMAQIQSRIGDLKRDLQPHTMGKVYLNFMMGDEVRTRLHDAFPSATLARLQSLKATYDPDHLLRFGYPLGAA